MTVAPRPRGSTEIAMRAVDSTAPRSISADPAEAKPQAGALVQVHAGRRMIDELASPR